MDTNNCTAWSTGLFIVTWGINTDFHSGMTQILLLAAAAPAVKPAHADHTSSSRSRSAARSRQLPGGSPAPAQQGAPPSWGTIPSAKTLAEFEPVTAHFDGAF